MDKAVPAPGEVDSSLNEFWEGDPWKIHREHNLSCFERNRLFMNIRGAGFLDISHLSGADNDGDSRSAIAVDVNHDGRLDLLLRQAGGGPFVLYENRAQAGHFVEVTLRATTGHPSAIGAKITAKIADRQVVRECFPVNAFRSQAPLSIHIGLGDAEKIDELTVRWPLGRIEVFKDLAADQRITLQEGEGTP